MSHSKDDDRPELGLSDAMLTATGPLTMPGPGEQWGRPQPDRPQLHGAADAVQGAPMTPPPAHDASMTLGTDSAGGFAVPKQLAGKKPRRRG